MQTLRINGQSVKMYDSIETMPITVFHRFNLYAAIDAGIGGTIEDVDRRLLRARQFIKHNQQENALRELDNMRQSMAFVIENSNPEMLSFAALIHSINGEEVRISDEASAREVLQRLNKKGLTVGAVRAAIEAVKKKWMGKWSFISRHKKNPARSSNNT